MVEQLLHRIEGLRGVHLFFVEGAPPSLSRRVFERSCALRLARPIVLTVGLVLATRRARELPPGAR